MTLMSALSAAVSGLRVTQTGVSVVSQNIANADSVGYSKRRVTSIEAAAGGLPVGARASAVQRVLDTVVQRQLWRENSGAGYTGLKSQMTKALETLYGAPGSASALETIYANFSGAVERLVDDPASQTARTGVVEAGRALAARIGAVAQGVQALRTEAEGRIASAVGQANALLAGIERVNGDIVSLGASRPSAALLDERDRLIGELSQLVDLQVQPQASGAVTILTGSGQTLFDGASAVRLSFDARAVLTPASRYDATPPSVGVIRASAAGGPGTDLIAAGAFRSGAIAAALEMRDVALPQAQRQLDELAAGLARAFSDAPSTVSGSGPFTLAPALAFPATLDVTVNGRFQRIAAASAADLDAALGALGGSYAAPTATLPGGSVIAAASTQAGVPGTGPFAFFSDGAAPFAGLAGQQTGFAQRMTVNPAVTGSPNLSALVGSGLAGDPTRPLAMRDGLRRPQAFSPEAGLSTGGPYVADVGQALRRAIETQGAAAEAAKRLDEGQRVALAAVEGRFADTSGVDIDAEMAQLVQLQTAYGANARVLSAVREMLDVLMRI